jgi:tetratricopeptide (TPR) repeat protein
MTRGPKDILKFWNELKRRKVIKATLVYLAVAYGILEASDIIFPALGLPQWTITFVLVLLIIVFILVLVLTWIYDITPEGIKVTQSAEEETAEKKKMPDLKDWSSHGQEEETTDAVGKTDMQKRIETLENELKLAREKSVPVKDIWKIAIKKLIVPVLIIAVVLLLVFNRQKLTKILGIGDAKRKAAMNHNRVAIMYLNNEDYEAAKSELEAAIKIDPGYSYSWSNMGVVSYRLGDITKAANQVTKAIELDPENSKAPYNLAFALQDKKDYQNAIIWYKEAIRIDSVCNRDSVYSASCSALGNLYNSMNMPYNAVVVISKALMKFPDSRYTYLLYKNLGNSYLLQEDKDSALKYLELSYRLQPSEAETSLFLAKAYESAGQLSKSIEQLEKYLLLETDTAKAGEAKRHLKETTIKHYQELIK